MMTINDRSIPDIVPSGTSHYLQCITTIHTIVHCSIIVVEAITRPERSVRLGCTAVEAITRPERSVR